MQTCPLVTKAASTSRSASAASPATSGARMAASLPPSSSTTGRVVAAAAAMTAWPVPTPPVKDTMSTSGWPTSAAPRAASGPFTTLRTPGGQRLGHGRGHQEHGARAGRRRLDHDGVAGQQRGEHLVAHDRDRPVEGQDRRPRRRAAPTRRASPRRRGRGRRAPRRPAARRRPPCRPWWRCRRSPPGGSCRARGSAAGPGPGPRPRPTPASAAAIDQGRPLVVRQRRPGPLGPAGGGHGQVELRRRGRRGVEHDLGRAGPGSSPGRCPRHRPRRRRR